MYEDMMIIDILLKIYFHIFYIISYHFQVNFFIDIE